MQSGKGSSWFFAAGAAILLLGTFLRLYALAQTPRFQRDTIEYVTNAAAMQKPLPQNFRKFRPRQLFYTWLLHLFPQKSIADAAVAFSVILGTLTIPVIGLLAWELTGKKQIALWTALFAAVCPGLVKIAVSGLREPGMLFFCMTGFWITLLAIRRKNWYEEIPAGAMLTLGILFRIEGLEIFLVSGVFLLLAFAKKKISGSDFLRHCGGLSAGMLAVVLGFSFICMRFASWLSKDLF